MPAAELGASARMRPVRSLGPETPSRVARTMAYPLSTARTVVSRSLIQPSRLKSKAGATIGWAPSSP